MLGSSTITNELETMKVPIFITMTQFFEVEKITWHQHIYKFTRSYFLLSGFVTWIFHLHVCLMLLKIVNISAYIQATSHEEDKRNFQKMCYEKCTQINIFIFTLKVLMRDISLLETTSCCALAVSLLLQNAFAHGKVCC